MGKIRRFNKVIFLVCFLFLGFSFSQMANAGKEIPRNKKDDVIFQAELQRMLMNNVHKIRSVLNERDLEMFDKIKFSFTINPDPHSVGAEYGKEGRQVVITTGFMKAMRDIQWAQIVAERSNSFGKLHSYVMYYVDVLNKHIENGSYKTKNMEYIKYEKYIKLSDSKINAIRNDEQAKKGLLWGQEQLIAFVASHEIGHHVLGHLENRDGKSEVTKKEELEADTYAMEIFAKTGFHPLACTSVYPFQLAVLGKLPNQEEDLNEAGVRAIILLGKAMEKASKDPVYMRFLRQTGREELWKRLYNDYQKYLKQLGLS